MTTELLEKIGQSQRSRIFHIDFRLFFLGTVTRQDLVSRFGIKEAAATRDLALYRNIAPGNLNYHPAAKKYFNTDAFNALFKYTPEQALRALSQGIGDDFQGIHRPFVSSQIPLQLNHPDLDVLSALSRAIHQTRPVEILYYSTSSGRNRRTIIPIALVDNGLRWHVRAYDRRREAFRDFVLTRMSSAKLLSGQVAEHEHQTADNQWNRIVDLELVPHPAPGNLAHPETIALDYGMTEGVLKLQVRAAVAGYLLRRWNVDCTENHSLEGREYQLWLCNHPTLYGVQNSILAPGYATTEKD